MAYADEAKAVEVPEDYGPIQKGLVEVHKRCEMLHLTMERLERKLRPVLRSVPDKPNERDGRDPHPVVSELTERITAISASLAALDQTINDMNSRCEL
jgi:hypothetical protein